jgi:hypothetical protein
MIPRLFLFDPVALAATKARLRAGEAALAAPHRQLIAEAEAALAIGPFSVMNKQVLPPSGDKHDYLSLARY